MDEDQFRQLCEACDRILLADGSTPERVAIPWLHVIREHPVFLSNYVDIFRPINGREAFRRRCWRELRNRAGSLRQLYRALGTSGKHWFGPDEMPEQIDVLFVSHLINVSHAGQRDDFYFSALPNELARQGVKSLIALINHTDRSGAKLVEMWKESVVPRVILSASHSCTGEMHLNRRLKTESNRLKQLGNGEAEGPLRDILMRASEEALSVASKRTLRMATQLQELVARSKPKAIVVTYEGHAWERLAFAAARIANPTVACIGYQHSAIFRLQHAIRRNLARQYNPDLIFTAGTVAKRKLEKSPCLNNTMIAVLGSSRAVKRAPAGEKWSLSSRIHTHSGLRACLVLPEGIASECHLMFDFSLRCARECPDIQFIWRLHPDVSFTLLAKQNKRLRDLPRNVVLSRQDLAHDIERCRWALYRGTTAIVQASGAGLRPVYVQLPGEMSVDPLYEMDNWRIVVSTADDLRRVIKADVVNPLSEGESAIASVERLLFGMFTPLNTDAFKRALMPDLRLGVRE